MNIFLNKQDELRSGWKFTSYWLLFVALLYVAQLAIPFSRNAQTQLERLVLNTILFVPAIGALVFMAKFVDKLPVQSFGTDLHPGWARGLGIGIGISIAMLALLTLINAAAGGVAMVWTASDTSFKALSVTAGVLVVSAAQEELVFRGYPFQVLVKGIGPVPAMVTMSVLFGAGHWLNPNATLLGMINTILAGLMLSLAYLKTRSLWLPYGLHLGWNLGLGFVLGYPLSGIHIDSLWKSVPAGPQWLVGSAYGPEGGLTGTVLFLGVAAVVSTQKFIRRTQS